MDERLISLEAVNAFETWMKELPESTDYDPEVIGYRLLELCEEYCVEDFDEILYLLNQYYDQVEEYVPKSKRYIIESYFNY